MKLPRRLAIPELAVVVVFIAILAAGGWFFFHGVGNSGKDVVEISDGGSTNAAGWDLKIHTDGSGDLACDNSSQKLSSCKDRNFDRGTFEASILSKDLADTKLGGYKDTCAYSASFGEVQTLIYRGQRTVGIDCYMQSSSSPLARDLNKVLVVANLSSN